jgi:hypothetical protein
MPRNAGLLHQGVGKAVELRYCRVDLAVGNRNGGDERRGWKILGSCGQGGEHQGAPDRN